MMESLAGNRFPFPAKDVDWLDAKKWPWSMPLRDEIFRDIGSSSTERWRKEGRESNPGLDVLAWWCSGIGIALGLLGVAGWMADLPILTSLRREYVPTSPQAASGHILLGFSLLAYLSRRRHPSGLKKAAVGACLLACLGVWGLFHTTGLVQGPVQGVGRALYSVKDLSPVSGVEFLGMGLGLLLLVRYPHWRLAALAPSGAALTGFVNLVGLLGYFYGTPLLYGGSVRPVGFLSSVTCLVLSIAFVLAAGPDYFPLRLLIGPSVTARLLRTFLPVIVLVVLSGELISEQLRMYPLTNQALQAALQTIASVVLVSFAVAQVAKVIGRDMDRAEEARWNAEHALREAHAELERRVEERTGALQIANAQLKVEVAERQRAKEALAQSEGKLRALLDAIPDWMFRLDREGNLLDAKAPKGSTAVCASASGQSLEEWLCLLLSDDYFSHIEKAFRTTGMEIFEFELPWQDGPRHFEARLVVSDNQEVIAILRDITETKRLESEILLISAREQRKIGQDLHDGIGQHLTGIAYLSKALQASLAEKQLPEVKDAEEIAQLAGQAIKQARSLSKGLVLFDTGPYTLEVAFQELAQSVSEMFQIRCTFEAAPPVQIQDHAVVHHLFRIAQEAISNAVKHGKATAVQVLLCEEETGLALSITDNGVGFPANAAEKNGLGLRIMKHRARSVGGTLQIERAKSGGVVVKCLINRTAGLRDPWSSETPLDPMPVMGTEKRSEPGRHS